MNFYDQMTDSVYQKYQERVKNKKRKTTIMTAVSAVALASILSVSAFLGTALDKTIVSKKISTEKVYADTFTFSQKAMQAYLGFTGKTFDEIKSKTNTLYSPVSLFLGLAILASGSNGTTKAEILSLLGMDEEDVNELSSSIVDYYHKLEPVDIENSVWIKQNFPVKQSFLDQNTLFFGNDIFVAPFDQTTVKDLNHWVEQATSGQIKKIIDKISPDIVMYILNSLHLEAKWREQFSTTIKDTFQTETELIQVDTLKTTNSYYYDSGNALAFVHSLENGVYFMGILPNSEDYTLDSAEINALFSGVKYGDENVSYRVKTSLPTFSYGNDLDLKEKLKSMGLGHMFEQADFSNISPIDLYVDSIVQHTKIDLDENGIKASAVLEIGFVPESAMPPAEIIEVNIELDRPFYYMIYTKPVYGEESNVLPIFMGYVSDPTN